MIHVIYHDNCYDGFGAAWVCHTFFSKQNIEVAYHPMKYGDEPPVLDNCTIYMVDFSLPREVMIGMAAKNNLIVLDHHKTAQANCEGLDFCQFDMERSGAGLTWDHFYPEGPRSPLVNYIEDRDLWRFKLPKSKEIHAWIQSYEKSFENFQVMDFILQTEAGTHSVASEGAAILRFEKQKVDEMCREARFVDVAGYSVPAVNTPYNFGSVVGEKLCEIYPDAPFAAYYFTRADGDEQWGLRSRGFDVSNVCRSLGGGGHQRAAGFVKGKVTR